MAKFEDYYTAPWYWFYIALNLGVEVSRNPHLSAKYDSEPWLYDIDSAFKKGMVRYNQLYGTRFNLWGR